MRTNDDDDQTLSSEDPDRGSQRGRLSVRLDDEQGKPVQAPRVLFLAENKATLANQYRIDSEGKDPLAGDFPAGPYSLQAFSTGYKVGRAFVMIEARRTAEVVLRLDKAPAKPPAPTQRDRLAVYGLADRTDLAPLTVRHRTVLDFRTFPTKTSFTILRPKSAADLKKWVGTPDSAFGHDQPRFGSPPAVPERQLSSPMLLSGSGQVALQALAREYIYGNSRSVVRFGGLIDRYVALVSETISVAIFLFSTVTIDDGAVLEIGNGSSVFFCDLLRIHKNGTLSVVGDMRADIGQYERFG